MRHCNCKRFHISCIIHYSESQNGFLPCPRCRGKATGGKLVELRNLSMAKLGRPLEVWAPFIADVLPDSIFTTLQCPRDLLFECHREKESLRFDRPMLRGMVRMDPDLSAMAWIGNGWSCRSCSRFNSVHAMAEWLGDIPAERPECLIHGNCTLWVDYRVGSVGTLPVFWFCCVVQPDRNMQPMEIPCWEPLHWFEGRSAGKVSERYRFPWLQHWREAEED